MTKENLLAFFENYYGEKYTGVVLEVTAAYLDGYSQTFYKAAAQVIVKRVSRAYGKSPGPAEFEKHLDEIFDTMPKPKKLQVPKQELSDEQRAEGITLLELIKQTAKKYKGAKNVTNTARRL